MKKKILALCLVVVLVATAITGVTLAYFTDTTEVVENTFTMGKVKIDLDEAPVDEDGKKTEGPRVPGNDYTETNMVPGHVFDKDPTIHVEKGSEESYIFLDMTFNKFSSLFWVMAADASADKEIAFNIFDENGALADAYKNEQGVFSTTKFLAYLVANKDARIAIVDKWFNEIVHEDWEIAGIIRDGDYLTIRFAYQGDKEGNKNTVNTKTATTDLDIKFMDSFQMPASVTQEMIENGMKIGNMENNFNTAKANFVMDFVAYAIQADEMADVTAAYKEMFGTDMYAILVA